MESEKFIKLLGAMLEIKKMLSLRFKIKNDFDYYSKKLSRFQTKLYDPIARVAREPLENWLKMKD